MDISQIQRVRRFNRVVTRRIGVLTDNYLGRGRPWGESRLMFEIGRGGATVRELRERLSLDSGYLSRLLRSLEGQGLVASRPSPDDARVRRLTLTSKGLREWKALETRSDGVAEALLAPLSPSQRTLLVSAMDEVERLLRLGAVSIAAVDPASLDARTCIAAYLKELGDQIGAGFDPSMGPTAQPEEMTPPHGVFLLASLDGEAVGCAALKTLAPSVGEIKRMWVRPDARGLGIGARLLAALEARAAETGLSVLRLDTNASHTVALALYRHSGYFPIPPYNKNPYADYWFEKRDIV